MPKILLSGTRLSNVAISDWLSFARPAAAHLSPRESLKERILSAAAMWRCEITRTGLRFWFFFGQRTVLWREIKSVRVVPFWKACLLSLGHFTISFSSWNLSGVTVVETKKNRLIMINPRDRDQFVERVRSYLS
jgi:hypothetical protein